MAHSTKYLLTTWYRFDTYPLSENYTMYLSIVYTVLPEKAQGNLQYKIEIACKSKWNECKI